MCCIYVEEYSISEVTRVVLPFLHDIAITEAVYSGKGAWVTYENHCTPIMAVIIALCAEDFVDYVSNVQAQHGGAVQAQHDGKGGLRISS